MTAEMTLPGCGFHGSARINDEGSGDLITHRDLIGLMYQ